MGNIYTRVPNRGDIVIKNTTTKEVKYIVLDSFDSVPSGYESVGVVYYREGSNVGVAYKTNSSQKYCSRAWWYLSGMTLDGAEHTGVLSLRFASNSWASNISKTITYTANNINEFIAALNAAFAADADMAGQSWVAEAVSGDTTKVKVHCNNIDYRQCSSNTASGGFTLSGSLLGIASTSSMRRRHGGYSSEGAISSYERALVYFTADNSSASYNPSSDLTSVKTTYPVCLPAYLGTSQYQSDHCALLRQEYGAGATGWRKYMRSCTPVWDCDQYAMSYKTGKALTESLASHVYNNTAMCNAASYCRSINTSAVSVGEFWLPSARELAMLLDGIQYGLSGKTRNDDPLNKGLNKIGGTAISNSSYFWSCGRCTTDSAWRAHGSNGFFCYGLMYSSYGCVPVSLYKIS